LLIDFGSDSLCREPDLLSQGLGRNPDGFRTPLDDH